MSAQAQAAAELLEASLALEQAVSAGDPVRLEGALARRVAAFEHLRELLAGEARAADEVQAAVQRVRAVDASTLEAVRSAAEKLGRELEGLAAARRAARAFRAQQAPDTGPRFIERRA